MKSEDNSFWLETVVCSARKGVDARLERMLEARQEMRRRTEGCVRAWVSRSMDGQPMFLLQAIYEDQDSWHRSAKRVAEELDSRDGGIENLLGGPPLVGIFSLDPGNLNLGNA
ncbi:MAG: antibiotic biosynthesis monooxygenase [Candidatus Poseidoniaceae archaeon]